MQLMALDIALTTGTPHVRYVRHCSVLRFQCDAAIHKQVAGMLSQALNRAMPRSCNQLEEGVNRKEIIFYLAVQL